MSRNVETVAGGFYAFTDEISKARDLLEKALSMPSESDAEGLVGQAVELLKAAEKHASEFHGTLGYDAVDPPLTSVIGMYYSLRGSYGKVGIDAVHDKLAGIDWKKPWDKILTIIRSAFNELRDLISLCSDLENVMGMDGLKPGVAVATDDIQLLQRACQAFQQALVGTPGFDFQRLPLACQAFHQTLVGAQGSGGAGG